MTDERSKRILVVGAGEAGRMVASELAKNPRVGTVAGFLDDDPALQGKVIESAPVLGKTGELERIISEGVAEEIIIAVPTAHGRFIREMVRRCRHAGVPYRIVPGVMEIIKGDVHIDQIREVRVEDLLGRETVDFDLESAREEFSGKKVLVTGAGGSIGSELCRQLARVGPSKIIMLGRGENRIFEIEGEIRSDHPGLEIDTVIANLSDGERIERLISDMSPDFLYHAAAHKHVHYMERDPEEAVINNIEGSINVIRAAERCGVERFVFISTDKAADPTGVMGASKRIIELYLSGKAGEGGCRFITVRFGNVIGSMGSVVPLFLRQIERGGPVTVSDPEASRYFMTVKEAAFLVIRSSLIGRGGEIFILDMGEALNILEMARDIIILSGHEPESEIPISITGLREGERLHEMLASGTEKLESSGEEKIFIASPSDHVPEDIEEEITRMIDAARGGRREDVIASFSRLIPGFGRQI